MNILVILGLHKNLGLQNYTGIFQNFLDFWRNNSEKIIIFRVRFKRRILPNNYDFWQFSINPPAEVSPDFFSGVAVWDCLDFLSIYRHKGF